MKKLLAVLVCILLAGFGTAAIAQQVTTMRGPGPVCDPTGKNPNMMKCPEKVEKIIAKKDGDFQGIYDKYGVIYSPKGKYFANGGMVEDRISLIKKTYAGTGSYSTYYYSKDNKKAFDLGSNYEFIKGKDLIAVHNADLTYYKVYYENGKFGEKKMTLEEIKEIFPSAKIIKISEFKNGQISVHKPFFKPVEILLVNDTNQYFHKYSYTPTNVNTTNINGLITVAKVQEIKFSHFGDASKEFPVYTIKVKKLF